MNRKWFVASMFRAHDSGSFIEKMGGAVNCATRLSCQISAEFDAAPLAQGDETLEPARTTGFTLGDARALVGAWTQGMDWLDILMNQ